ncbi:MAG: hypothetical protein ACTSYB_18170 [Candidatus Helarchaeota archaeon]
MKSGIDMSEQVTFEYESDWVNYFNSILKNEIRQEIENPNKIKANIVESNQSLEDFLKRNPEIKRIPSREKFFHNLKIKYKENYYYFYLNNRDERFWIIHNIEKQREIQHIINNLTSNNYLQDKIYLSHKTLEKYQEKFNTESFGFTLNFEQLFSSQENKQVFIEELNEFDNIAFTLQLWPKRKKSLSFFINKFRLINCPINLKSLNFVFEDETNEVLVKEDFFYDGSTTIHRGKDIRRHLKFLNEIRDDYRKKIELIEENRINWDKLKGNLFTFEFNKKINPKNFIKILNQKKIDNTTNPFKINAFFMYKEDEFFVYNCVDLHTGGKFYMHVFPSKLQVNLNKDSCGNIILRLYTNLQRYFSVSVKITVDGDEWKI